MTDQADTQQAADDRRYVDPADLPRLHRARPLRTARLLARGVGPARGRVLPPGRVEPGLRGCLTFCATPDG